MASSFPRVVRTTHADDGKSVFASDDHLQPFAPFGPNGSKFTVFDARDAVPVNNTDPIPSFANTIPRCPPGGSIFCISDFPPGAAAPMHRTVSIDYAIILSGEIVMTLDSGEEKTIKTGEFIVQQGVNHSWSNKTDQVCRMACVMLGAEKVVTKNGEVLEQTIIKKP